MAAFLLTTFSDEFPLKTIAVFWFKLHLSFFLQMQWLETMCEFLNPFKNQFGLLTP